MIITKDIILLCNTNYITVEELIYLYTLYIEEDWRMNIYPASIFKLERLGFLKNGILTSSGESLLADIPRPTPSAQSKDRFEEFWLAFPRDDEHHTFPKTRAIRINKALTRLEFNNVIEANKATQEQLIDSVTKEVAYRKSFRTENYLRYMKSPPNWLRDSIYLDTENFSVEEGLEDVGYGKEVN